MSPTTSRLSHKRSRKGGKVKSRASHRGRTHGYPAKTQVLRRRRLILTRHVEASPPANEGLGCSRVPGQGRWESSTPAFDKAACHQRSLNRCILPVALFGSSGMNSIHRGYLNLARRSSAHFFNSSASSSDAEKPSRSTT